MVGRSQIVTLTLVGVVGALLAARAASPVPQMRRNVYNWRQDCERDYSPAQCQPSGSNVSSGSGYSAGGWHGPSYYADRSAAQAKSDPGPGRYGLRAGVVNASLRGGFGAFGRALHAVG